MWTGGYIISTGPQCGDKCIATLEPHTGNQYRYKNRKKARGQPERRTDGHILLPLRGFEPGACGRMCCAQLWAAQMIFYLQFKAVFQTKNPIKCIYQKSLFYGGLLKKSFKKL